MSATPKALSRFAGTYGRLTHMTEAGRFAKSAGALGKILSIHEP